MRTRRARQKQSPWINQSLLSKMRQRDYLKKVACQTNDPSDWSRYKTSRNEVNNLTRQTKANYNKDKLNNSDATSKETWRTINEVMGRNSNKTNSVTKIDYHNKEITKPADIANAFNTHFVSIVPNLAEKSFGNERTDNFEKFLPQSKTS